MRTWLTLQAWSELFYVDLVVKVRGFRAVRHLVTGTRTRAVSPRDGTPARVVDALNAACLYYFKPAQCLQRSVVVTRLLRRRGVDADLVIGCYQPPLRAHAWVEVDGEVVLEGRPGLAFYQVLDRW